jgi:hypothetical protein
MRRRGRGPLRSSGLLIFQTSHLYSAIDGRKVRCKVRRIFEAVELFYYSVDGIRAIHKLHEHISIDVKYKIQFNTYTLTDRELSDIHSFPSVVNRTTFQRDAWQKDRQRHENLKHHDTDGDK